MCDQHLSRRDFLRLGALTVGGIALAGCRGDQIVKVTATPSATTQGAPAAQPVPTLAPGVFADTLFVNGKIVTMDASDSVAQAIAIKDGLILRTGTTDAIRAHAGANTKVIDLRGKTLTPGIIDTHNHLSVLGLVGPLYIDINPPAVRTLAELQAKIAEAVAKKPKGEWVIAQGFISFEGRNPEKRDLDPVSPNHPVMLINQGGHVGTVNSYALKLANVTASTPNPKYGMFGRDAKGEPNGVLVNHSAMDIFRKLWANLMTPQIYDAAITSPQPKFAAVGVTTFCDNNARGLDRMKAYFDAGRNHKMTIRGAIMNTIEYYPELAGRADKVKAMQYEDDYMRLRGYKFLVDGAVAAMHTHEPHKGMAWDIATWEPRALNEAVKTLHAAGFQCSFHVIGDAAVDMALDAIEGAQKANPRADARHRIEHAVLNTDRALKRTKDLGVIVSTQPQGIRLLGDYFREILGEERAKRIIPTRTWLDLGVPLCLSSDSPTLPWYSPQVTLAGALARVTGSNQVIAPDQCLTFKEAIRAHTVTSAYALFQEKIKGSLEPGKMADVIVWTEDPYALAWQQLYNTTIELTMVGGKVVYQKS
ncbi:MAG: amidohydrolase [Chloroflexi bacterium]|nr:amidohydrolase [Chloroflexota bacterium]